MGWECIIIIFPFKVMKSSLLLFSYYLLSILSAVATFWIIRDTRIRSSTIERGVSLNYLGYKGTFCFLDSKSVTLSHFNVSEIGVCFVINVYI